MFCKLKDDFKIDDYQIMEERMSFKDMIDGQLKGISYHRVSSNKESEIMAMIPTEYQQYFDLNLMYVDVAIPPHTDSGIKSTINFYIKTDDCLTQFYEFNTNSPKTRQVDNQSDGFLFNENDLIKTDSFVAKPNEVWLLDVSKPHSVQPQTKFNSRLAIALSSVLEYNQVKDILIAKGYL